MANELRNAATEYHRKGYSVIPLKPNSKEPAISWTDYQKRLMSLADITAYWIENPDYNVGIITGKISGISVIDIDGDDGVESIRNAPFTMPQTKVVKTPNGYHHYLKYDNRFAQGAGKLDHVDIRNDGGYVVAPPSIVDGVGYTVSRDKEVLDWGIVPEPFTKGNGRVHDLEPSASLVPWVTSALENGVSEGERNFMATRLAGYFHSRNLPNDIITQVLTGFGSKCTPPLSEREISTVIDSVSRYTINDSRAFADGEIPKPLVKVSPSQDIVVMWADNGITVHLDQPSKERERIRCRLTVNTSSNGFLYGPVSFDLLSGTKRLEAERALKKRQDEDWGTILEYACRLGVSALETPSDFINMSTYQKSNANANTWLIEGLLAKNKPTLLYADGGTGKSYLALSVAMSITQGVEILPGLPPVDASGGAVLYLDWEADGDDLADRIEAIARTVPAPDGETWTREDFNIEYLRCTVPLVHMQEKIKQKVQDAGVQLVIIDSLHRSIDGDLNDSETPRKFFQVLRALEVPSLIISHTSKNPDVENDRARPFGSAYWWNEARSVWELRKEQSAGDEYVDLALINRKSNNWNIAEPIGLRMRSEDMKSDQPKVSYEPITLASQNNSLAKAIPVKARIMGLLNGHVGGLTVKEIADELNEQMDTVRQALRRGAGSNFIQEIDQSNNTKTWKLN